MQTVPQTLQPVQPVLTTQPRLQYVTKQQVVTLPQQQGIATLRRDASPVSVVGQLAAQPKRAQSPLVLSNSQLQALTQAGTPLKVVSTGSVTPGNVVYLPQGGATPGTQGTAPKKITVIKSNQTGAVQQVISVPSRTVQQPIIHKSSSAPQIVNRQSVQTVDAGGGKRVHVVTLSPQVVQTPDGPRTVHVKKVESVPETTAARMAATASGIRPAARVVPAPPAKPAEQHVTVTKTSDGQYRIVSAGAPVRATAAAPAAANSNLQGLIRVRPNLPRAQSVGSTGAVTLPGQQHVTPRVTTVKATPVLTSRTNVLEVRFTAQKNFRFF